MFVGEVTWRATNFLSSNRVPVRPAQTYYKKKKPKTRIYTINKETTTSQKQTGKTE